MIFIASGFLFAVIAIATYVYKIFHLPKEQRDDYKNLILKDGKFFKNGTNILFIISIILIIIGIIVDTVS